MKRLLMIAASLLVAMFSVSNANATTERRVALVIGNNNYQHIPKLEKAVNDANAVARELTKVGFEVLSYNNVGQKKMNQAVNEFVQKVSGGGVGIFFFAGHGLQINNQNFLVPIDMDPPRDNNDVADQAINVPLLQDKLAEAKAKFTLLVLDACRDNPLPKKTGTRAIGASRGLALPVQTPSGQVVLYSAGANQQALDKLSDDDSNPNGLFTREFLPTISQPGVSATDAMKKVRSTVIQKAKTVGHEQQPALYDQTDGDFYFVPGPASGPVGGQVGGSTTTVIQSVDPKTVELAFWDSIRTSNNPEDFTDYLSKYPDGQFSQLAKRRVAAPAQVATRSSDATPIASSAPMQLAMGSAPAPNTSNSSISSKIEEQGKMIYLKVTDLRATKRDNLLRVQAEVTNSYSGNQQLYYRFKWLDRDGFSAWDEEPWKPLIIYGNQKQTISIVAPTFKATDFRLILQSPDNNSK
jgi:uncharacterized protein YcfL